MIGYGVPVTAILDALQQQVVLSPGGYLTTGHQDVFIEVRNLPGHILDLEQIPISIANGPIPLGNLAHIVRAPVPTLNAALLDSRPTVALVVWKQPGASTVPVSQSVRQTLAATVSQLPRAYSGPTSTTRGMWFILSAPTWEGTC